MTQEIHVQMYTPEYREQTIQLLSLLWTDKTENEFDKYFTWKYENYLWKGSPLITLALHDGRVIGALGHMLQKFLIGDKECYACVPVDGVVIPEYRKYGVYTRLLELGRSEIETISAANHIMFYFNASSNHRSAPGLVNQGWTALAPRSYLFKFSPLRILRTKCKISKTEVACDTTHWISGPYELKVAKQADVKAYINMAQMFSMPVKVCRDAHFYQWRYSFKPERYRFLSLCKNGTIVAVAVVQTNSWGELSIEEYFCRKTQDLIKLIRLYGKVSGYKSVRLFYLNLSCRDKLILFQSGFIGERLIQLIQGRKQRPPAYIRALSRPLGDFEPNRVDVFNAANWTFFKADIL